MKTNNLYIYKYEDLSLEIASFFSDYRLEKINNSNNEKLIKRMIETEYVLFYILRKHLNITKLDFIISGSGRPVLKNSKLNFNISHSKDYLIIAISDENISCDIEYLDSKHLKIRKRLYHNYQNKTIDDVIKDFTIKEGFIKYFSGSVTEDLKNINISDKYVFNKDHQLSYQSIKFKDYYISVLKAKPFLLNITEVNSFNCLLNLSNYNKI